MYPVSPAIRQIIDDDYGNLDWVGTITLPDGTVHPFDTSYIIQGTAHLNSSCNAPGVGGAVSTEFSVQLFTDISVQQLENAIFSVACRVSGFGVQTWDEVSVYSWSDVLNSKWNDEEKVISKDIPLGVFTIDKAKRQTDAVSITAYDHMQKFNIPISGIDITSRLPFEWLTWVCQKCNVPLGMTSSEVVALPNGDTFFVFADSNSVVNTFTDFLSQLATALCSVAMINRYGELCLVSYTSEPIATITPDDRFSSEFDDYQVSFTGAYSQFKAGAIQEYYRNVDEEYDTGSILDLGCNPFLQISNAANRERAVKRILNVFKNVNIAPFTMNLPYDPTYDLMDLVAFTGNHAPDNATAPITDFSRTLNGDMTIRCDLDRTSPDLARYNSEIDGVSGDSIGGKVPYVNQGFWLKIGSYPDVGSRIIGAERDTTTVTIICTVDNTEMQIVWTGDYILEEDAIVTAKVFVDDENIYEVADKQTAGNHVLNVSTGYTITTGGEHKIKVKLKEEATESIIDANDISF